MACSTSADTGANSFDSTEGAGVLDAVPERCVLEAAGGGRVGCPQEAATATVSTTAAVARAIREPDTVTRQR